MRKLGQDWLEGLNKINCDGVFQEAREDVEVRLTRIKSGYLGLSRANSGRKIKFRSQNPEFRGEAMHFGRYVSHS